MLESYLKNLPIKKKLLSLIGLVTGGALLVFSVLSLINYGYTLYRAIVENINIVAESVSEQSSAVLSFRWASEADTHFLKVLKNDPDIEVVIIYDKELHAFATYLNAQFNSGKDILVKNQMQGEGGRFLFQAGTIKLEIICPIVLAGKRIGTVYVLSNLNRLKHHLTFSILMMIGSFFLVFLSAIFVASRLQSHITRPVFTLATSAKQISENNDYSIRVESSSKDEIGELISDFNQMVETIEIRDRQLIEHRENLEWLVRKRTEELVTKCDEALAAAKAKSEFLANMSHEIRTPMNGIVGVLSLLEDAPLSSEYESLLKPAISSADSLLVLIDDILDFSKIDAGKVMFEARDFDLRELVEDTVDLFVDSASEKNVELISFVPPELNCKINGDPVRLRQILSNLLSNALKFTDGGYVSFVVRQESKSNRELVLYFSVEDTGIGIKPERMGEVFDKFSQADSSISRKYGGTGLGLSVSKQLVEMQGGEIGVMNRKEKGSVFWFTLPFMIPLTVEKSVFREDIGGIIIIITTTSSKNRIVLEQYLLHFGYAPVFTRDIKQGIKMFFDSDTDSAERVQLILDVSPNENESEPLLEYFRDFGYQGGTDVMLMCSRSDAPFWAKYTGITNLIFKPIRLTDLYETLSETHGTGGYEHPFNLDPRNKQLIHRIYKGKLLLVDDELVNRQIADAILRKYGMDVDIAENGKRAIDMVRENDYCLILMDIHMPDKSGIEVTREIREIEQVLGKDRVPIVAMTANATKETKQNSIAAGMDDFITKPVKPTALLERISPYLETVEQQDKFGKKDVMEVNKKNMTIPSTEIIWDREGALELVGGDMSLFTELARSFIDRNCDLLENLSQAIEMDDADQLQEAAHTYKGAVGQLGSPALRKLASELEIMAGKNGVAGTSQMYAELERKAGLLVEELQETITAYSL